jgi:hypothetical protein
MENNFTIKKIEKIISEFGYFKPSQVNADPIPHIHKGEDWQITEFKRYKVVIADFSGDSKEEICYTELPTDVLDRILELAEDWEAESYRTQKRISD